MYFEEEEEYLSQPIDEKNQSSYIKINKQFLEQLKSVNHADDISEYKQSSDEQQNVKTSNFKTFPSKFSNKGFEINKIGYDSSPIKSNFYKDIIDQNNQEKLKNESILKSSAEKRKSRDLTPQEKRQFLKLTQKIQKLSQFDKKQVNTLSDNTFEYYLLRKIHDQKYNDTEFLGNEQNEGNHMNEIKTKPQLFSPKNQLNSTSNRIQSNQKMQFQRINYKKLLQNEISKNKDLQRQVYKLESKLAHLNLQYEESTKYSKKLEKQLSNASILRKQNKNRMKELDQKLQGFKTVCKAKNNQKDSLLIETRKQNKILREQNQKYRVFTETLAQSIFVLKGRKPKALQEIWQEWKEVFENFSKQKWNVVKLKSPNKKA